MHFLMADKRTLNGDAVHHLFHARKQIHGEVDAGVDLVNLEILRSRRAVFEVESVQMADGPGDFEEDGVARIPTRMSLRARIRGEQFQRPDAFELCAEQGKSTVLQQLPASWDQVTDGPGTIHSWPPVRSCTECQKLYRNSTKFSSAHSTFCAPSTRFRSRKETASAFSSGIGWRESVERNSSSTTFPLSLYLSSNRCTRLSLAASTRSLTTGDRISMIGWNGEGCAGFARGPRF